MQSIERRDLECLCKLVFSGHTSGYAFFFWLEENLIVYPHSKYGFGFVAETNFTGVTLSRAFLEGLNQELFIVETL